MQETTVDAVMGALDIVRDAHITALNAGDAEGWVTLFTEDGVQMPPNSPANVGRESIRAWSQGFLGYFNVEFALTVAEVKIAGDWAFERGGYNIVLSPKPGGGSMSDAGKYITIYERQADGVWAIARDIWNTDNPLPG